MKDLNTLREIVQLSFSKELEVLRVRAESAILESLKTNGGEIPIAGVNITSDDVSEESAKYFINTELDTAGFHGVRISANRGQLAKINIRSQ